MTKQNGKVSDSEIEEFSRRFRRRYILKKKVNALLCFLIAFCGISAVIYSMLAFHKDLFDRLRFLTYCGTIFTAIVSFAFGVVCFAEAAKETEVTYKWVYFLRLSSAATELIIFAVVMFGLLPIVPDIPDVRSYSGIMTHIVVPFATVASFLLNDPPFGKPKAADPLKGMIFVGFYGLVMTISFASGILSSEIAPYSFFDFKKTSLLFKLACLAGILAVSYGASWLLMRLNMKLSWVWFYDLKKRKKKG